MEINVTLPEDGQEEKQAEEKDQELTEKLTGSPFKKATKLNKRLKLFLWGDTGAGKTTLALQFPRPVVIDGERGTDLYAESWNFDVIRTTQYDEAYNAIEYLARSKHNYATLIIDPITIFWESLQNKWSDIFRSRNKQSKGYKFEYYDFQPRDWMTIKSDLKSMIRKLISLDMNIIVTAREKTKYKEGSMMVSLGETFDGEKNLPYMFDTIVRLYFDGEKHMAFAIKDRSNKLPKTPFIPSYSLFEKCFGSTELSKEPEPVKYATTKQKKQIRDYIKLLALAENKVKRALSQYEVETIEDLTKENATIIIAKLEKLAGK